MRRDSKSLKRRDDAATLGDATVAHAAALRWLIVAAQAVTIVITWPLWQVRQWPPNLPAVDVPQIGVGWVLLASLAVVLVWPMAGVVLHGALLAAAMLMDQMRIQPEFISLAILLWGTLPLAGAAMIARAHLVAMWLYAGLHKLLSVDYLQSAGADLLQAVMPQLPDGAAQAAAVLLAILEISLAVGMLVPRTRRAAAWMACALHLGVVLSLSPLGRNWNQAVWAWNVVLAAAGFAWFAGWKDSPWAGIRQCRPVVRGVVLLLIVSPAGYYVGMVDAYLAHCLYSSNTPRGVMVHGEQRTPLPERMVEELNVPFPPAHRLYEAYFRSVAEGNDRLDLDDPRWWAKVRGIDRRTLTLGGEYRGGKKHGLWTFRDQNGNKTHEGQYVDGREHGRWTLWEDGKTYHVEYRDGRPVGGDPP